MNEINKEEVTFESQEPKKQNTLWIKIVAAALAVLVLYAYPLITGVMYTYAAVEWYEPSDIGAEAILGNSDSELSETDIEYSYDEENKIDIEETGTYMVSEITGADVLIELYDNDGNQKMQSYCETGETLVNIPVEQGDRLVVSASEEGSGSLDATPQDELIDIDADRIVPGFYIGGETIDTGRYTVENEKLLPIGTIEIYEDGDYSKEPQMVSIGEKFEVDDGDVLVFYVLETDDNRLVEA